MNSSILVSILVVIYVCFVNGQSCNTPNQAPGTCISIYDCESLLKILNDNFRTNQDLELLQRSRCGFDGNLPKVCCPLKDNECIDPGGNTGTCVDLYNCPHLAQLINPPVSQQSINFLQQSKCLGPTAYSVCCGPKPLLNKLAISPPTCKETFSVYPPDPSTGCCGVDSRAGNKIFGGTATAVDQYPWLVLIDYYNNEVQTKQKCGGALISNRYVLTAAHCVAAPVLKNGIPRVIRLSEYDLSHDGRDCTVVEANGEDCTEGELRIPIERIIQHPDYKPTPTQQLNDIALIRLARAAPYTDFIRPICLPSSDITQNPPVNVTTAGWGAISLREPGSIVKLYVDLPLVDLQRCKAAYTTPTVTIPIWNKHVCAGGQKGKDTCKGDSGGPLMYENGRFYEAIGIVSFGPRICATENVPGVYTKVLEYKDWIMSNIQP